MLIFDVSQGIFMLPFVVIAFISIQIYLYPLHLTFCVEDFGSYCRSSRRTEFLDPVFDRLVVSLSHVVSTNLCVVLEPLRILTIGTQAHSSGKVRFYPVPHPVN